MPTAQAFGEVFLKSFLILLSFFFLLTFNILGCYVGGNVGRWERCGERGKFGNARAGGFLFSFLGGHKGMSPVGSSQLRSVACGPARGKDPPRSPNPAAAGRLESGLWGQKCGRFLLLPTD